MLLLLVQMMVTMLMIMRMLCDAMRFIVTVCYYACSVVYVDDGHVDEGVLKSFWPKLILFARRPPRRPVVMASERHQRCAGSWTGACFLGFDLGGTEDLDGALHHAQGGKTIAPATPSNI